LERAKNHAWSAHGGGKWTPETLETVEFKMYSQCGTTRFDQMQLSQLVERACNNNQKRTILKELVKESNFAGTNSKFIQLVDHFGRNRVVPLFSRTDGRLQTVDIRIADAELTVKINTRDKDFKEVWHRIAPVVILRAQTGCSRWFGFDVHHHTDPSITTLIEKLTALLEGLHVEIPIIVNIVSFCCKLTAIFNAGFTPGVVGPLVVDSIFTSGTPVAIAQQAWALVKDHFAVVAQMLRGRWFTQSSGVDPVVSCTTVIAVLAGAILMKQIPRDTEISECIAGVTRLGALVRGATFAWTGLEKLITFILEKIFEWQTGLPAETKVLEQYTEGISAWFLEIQNLVGLGTYEEIAKDSALCSRLATLYREGLVFSQRVAESKAPKDVLAPFHVHWATLKGLYEKATASGAFRAGPRIEPVVIYLYGTSGVGKSGMVWPLATDLLRVDGIPTNSNGVKDPTLDIYMRNPEQDYWDGYRGQRVTVYDDFAQIVDSVGKPNPEFMELIRTGNLAPYPLHMATIEEKAKTFFTSRVVLCTSNVPVECIRPESIAHREAVKRRFDLVAEVKVKQKFTKRGPNGEYFLDRDRVVRMTKSEKPSLDVYDIYLRNPLSGALVHSEPLSYNDFMELCVRKYKQRFHQSTHLHDFLREYAEHEFPTEEILLEWHNPDVSTDSLDGSESQHSRTTEIVRGIIDEVVRNVEEEDPPMVAQILTDEEELNWLTNESTTVELCTKADMSSWIGVDIMNFVEQFPRISYMIDEDSLCDFQDFVDSVNRTKRYEWTKIVEDWNAMLSRIHTVWGPQAPYQMRYCARFDTLFRYSMHKLVIKLVPAEPSMNAILVARLRSASEGWLEAVSRFKDNVFQKLKDFPYVTIGRVAIPFIILFFRGYLKSKTVVSVGGPLDFTHEGLKPGTRAQHKHVCLWCSREYEHTHTIRSPSDSVQFPQICGECDRKDAVVNIVEREDEIGYEVICGRRTVFRPEPKLALYTELTASGDVVTRKSSSLRTELTGSGDVATRKRGGLRTELVGSGDVRTRKGRALRTELTGSGDPRSRRIQNLRTEIGELEDSRDDIHAQLLTDVNAHQISQKILRNMYDLELQMKDGTWGARIKVCFIVGRTALTARHLIPHLEKGANVRLTNKNVRQGHLIPVSKLRWVEVWGKAGKKDQMLIEFPNSVHDHSDIRCHIASSTEMTKFSSVNGCLISPVEDIVMMKFGAIRSVDRNRTYSDITLENPEMYAIRGSYQYDMECQQGDCGSILMAIHSGLARKIIGIHVAGGYGLGMSSPLNIEDITRALNEISLEAQISLNLDPLLRDMQPDETVKLPEGDFVPVGKAQFTIATPTKTDLRPSSVHGVITTPNTAPSALRKVWVDGVLVDPMQMGLKKAGKIPPSIDKVKLRACLNDVKRIVNTAAEYDHSRVLTDMESVAGIEGDPFVSPINRKSSPGYPYAKYKNGKPGKTRWLGNDEYILDSTVQEQMHVVIENAKNNERTPTIWADTLKDERRPLEKVKAGKTRVFSAGPMVFTLVFRKYFLGFAAHCAKNRIDNEISIGTNVYSPDWSRTADKLCSKGNKVIAGDFANFDGTLILEILAEIVNIVNDHYNDGEENAQIRRVLWKEIVNSVHVCGDDVYMWTHSQPSGCPITAILNSLYNSISMRYVWMSVMPAEYCTMRAFNEHVAMVSYGDDNCVGISDAVVDHFNQLTIAKGYADIGMTYTDEAKSGEMIPYRTIHDIAYLKRRFVWNDEEHQWVAPLDLDVVLEMVNWVRGDFDIEEKTRENMETSAFELSLHGRETFEKWITKYEDATRNFRVRPLLLTYDEYRLSEAKKYGAIAAACN